MRSHLRASTLRTTAVAVLMLVGAACSDDDEDSDGASASVIPPASVVASSAPADTPTTADATATTGATATSESATTELPATTGAPATTAATTTTEEPTTTAAPTTTEAPSGVAWAMQEAPEDCMCADGSPFNLWTRTDDTERVVLYFQGGGACFSAESCSFTDGSYDPTVDDRDDPANAGGIFDFANGDNPFAGWSVVYVPYCTGDVHIGDATTAYSPELTVEHKGYRNAAAALDFLVENFPDAAEVFVTGSSAGGIPSPLFGGLVSDRLPDADVAVLADAAGGYQSIPAINGAIGVLWGTGENIPDWPETAGITAEQYGVPDQFVFAGTHDPDIRMARYDNAWDEVQRTFADATGMGDVPLPDVLDQNEALVETAGVDLSVYVAPGEDHTILLSSAVYTLTVEGVSFLDWLTRFVNGETPGDVRCTDCEPPDEVDPEPG